MADVFLSYSHRDRDVVREVQRLLEACGITTFLDCDDLRRGEPWPSAIEQALASSRSVVALLGRELGRWQRREIWVALDRQVAEEASGRSFPVIPVLLPGSDVGSGFLFTNAWVDLRDGVADLDETAALADAITGTEGSTPAQSRGDSGVCRYRGLDAFREEDAAFFRGREEVVKVTLAAQTPTGWSHEVVEQSTASVRVPMRASTHVHTLHIPHVPGAP